MTPFVSEPVVWLDFDPKRHYEQLMVAWAKELCNSPASFPSVTWRGALPELIPVMDAHVMTRGATRIVTDGYGSFLGWRVLDPSQIVIVAGQAAAPHLAHTRMTPTTWHGGAGFQAGRTAPWRLFTQAPPVLTSRAALRRQARALAACQEQGLV